MKALANVLLRTEVAWVWKVKTSLLQVVIYLAKIFFAVSGTVSMLASPIPLFDG